MRGVTSRKGFLPAFLNRPCGAMADEKSLQWFIYHICAVSSIKAGWPNGKALDYESRDCRFDPCVGQFFDLHWSSKHVFFGWTTVCIYRVHGLMSTADAVQITSLSVKFRSECMMLNAKFSDRLWTCLDSFYDVGVHLNSNR